MDIKKTYVLLEAGGDLGFGHLIRSYTLCERLEILDHTFPIIKLHGDKEQIMALNLFRNEINFINLEEEIQPIYNSILIVDGYTFDIDYLNSLNKSNNCIIFIADVHKNVPNCEVLINHLPWITKNQYSGIRINQFFLGPDYAILRKAFFKKASKPEGRFLICLGSSNVSNEITSIYKALKSINVSDDLIDIVHNRPISEIPIPVLKNLNSEQMFQLIETSKYTFITPGNISYEVFSLNRNCIMGSVSISQMDPLIKFQKLNLCVGVGDWAKTDFSNINKWLLKSNSTIESQKLFFVNLQSNLLKKKLLNFFQK